MSLQLSPSTLNAKSQGNWIAAQIQLGFSPAQVVMSSLTLDGVGMDMEASLYLDQAGSSLTVKFPRAPFVQRATGTYQVTLLGRRADGVTFRGMTTLEINNGALSRLKASRGHSGVVITLVEPEAITLDVVDLQGRLIGRLMSGVLPAGEHVREWPQPGESVPRGSYFVRLRRAQGTDVVKLSVLP